jgi:hypothetical protein
MQTRWRQTRLTSARGARDEYSATLSHAGRANVKPANFVAAFLLIAFVASTKLQNEKENIVKGREKETSLRFRRLAGKLRKAQFRAILSSSYMTSSFYSSQP